MSREWAYVALSRGRLGNRLYVAARPDDARAEFAPGDPGPRDPIERMAAAMRASSAKVLAIDSGSSILGERWIEADRAARDRRGLERQGRTWLPRRRRRLEQARQRELAAAAALIDAERTESERRHGARPFVTEHELDARLEADREGLAERATERILRRSRVFGREL